MAVSRRKPKPTFSFDTGNTKNFLEISDGGHVNYTSGEIPVKEPPTEKEVLLVFLEETADKLFNFNSVNCVRYAPNYSKSGCVGCPFGEKYDNDDYDPLTCLLLEAENNITKCRDRLDKAIKKTTIKQRP